MDRLLRRCSDLPTQIWKKYENFQEAERTEGSGKPTSCAIGIVETFACERVPMPTTARRSVVPPPPSRPVYAPPPSRVEGREKMKALERAYQNANWHKRRKLVVEYLALLDNSPIVLDLMSALKKHLAGKKSPLFCDDAPALHLAHPFRRWFEGYASALLEWAIENRFAKQDPLAERLAKIIAEVGWYRSTWGTEVRQTLSKSSVIKWRSGCKTGTHPATADFNNHLERLRGWGFESVDEALEEFKSYVEWFMREDLLDAKVGAYS